MKERIAKLSIVALCLSLLLYVCSCKANPPTDTANGKQRVHLTADSGLEVTFLDVGQADSALLCCDDYCMLIDGGNVEDSDSVVALLANRGVDSIDYVVNSHPDEDHVGGLAGVLEKFDVQHIMSSVSEYDTKAFNNFKANTEKQGKTIEIPSAGDTFSLGSSNVQVISPQKDYNDVNDNSLVLKVSYGNTSFMFTGDISREVEDDIINNGYNVKSDVLKVAHHGSKDSTGYIWLNNVLPKYAVISVGKYNNYNHPSEDTLSRLRDADTEVYRTDEVGSVKCVSDKKDIKVIANGYRPISETISEQMEEIKKITQSISSAAEMSYIGNKESKVFHSSDCKNLPSEKNRVSFSDRQEAINEGYKACSNCNP